MAGKIIDNRWAPLPEPTPTDPNKNPYGDSRSDYSVSTGRLGAPLDYSAPITMNNGSTRYKDSSGSWMPAGFDPTQGEYGEGGPGVVSFGQNPTGSGAIGDDAYNRQQEMLLADKLARDRMASFSSLMGGDGAPRERYSGPNADETAARNAAFARAKEQAGATARASLMSLQGVIDERGMTGSSAEAAGAGAIINEGRNTVGDFTREQLMQDLGRAERIADLQYQGNITQRGQDLNRQQALLGLMAGAAY